MKKKLPDIEADTAPSLDRGENCFKFEPLVVSYSSPHRQKLSDLIIKLVSKSSAFKSSLPHSLQSSLATIVRSMNCYYSNLIEGHNTHPIEIEQALKGDLSTNIKKRNLQLEAKAHIAVQTWIDEGGINNNFYSQQTICEIHKKFYSSLPNELLQIENPNTQEVISVIPGQIRQRDVQVGRHLAISPGAVPRFLDYYEKSYNRLNELDVILSLAASHHRLLWIHPFLDGNGRVARLLSHALTLKYLNNNGLWSIARGLARNVTEYKSHLANCDLSRRNDLDGRGNLSEGALIEFTYFFLATCIDQVDFMEKLMAPNTLRNRVLLWAQEEAQMGNLATQSIKLLDAILTKGEIFRGELPALLSVSDRHARRISKRLIEEGVLYSDSPRAPLKIIFPAKLAERWMPGLFPAI